MYGGGQVFPLPIQTLSFLKVENTLKGSLPKKKRVFFTSLSLMHVWSRKAIEFELLKVKEVLEGG